MNSPTANQRLNAEEVQRRSEVVESRPTLVTLETTSVCNLRCVMCGQAVGVNRPGHLSEDLLRSVQPFLESALEIQLHGIGEPMLSPSFWTALEITSAGRDQSISVNSNALLLDSDRIERILDSKLSYISVSLDAATSETYRRIRGADLDRVTSNIRQLRERRDARGQSSPQVFVNMTLMRSNIEETVRFMELAHELKADAVYLWQLNAGRDWIVERSGWVFDYEKEELAAFPELSDRCLKAALERAEELGLSVHLDQNKVLWHSDDGSAATAPANTGPADAAESNRVTVRDCTHPWDWLMLTADGEVAACCYMKRPALGNLKDRSLDEIWNGREMRSLRLNLAAGEVHPLCCGATCKYVAGTDALAGLIWRRRLRQRLRNARRRARRAARRTVRRLGYKLGLLRPLRLPGG